MLKAYKFRLYPTKAQQELIDKHFRACNYVYNLALETKEWAWKSHRININRFDTKDKDGNILFEGLGKQLNGPNGLKQDVKMDWLKEVDSQALNETFIHLENAYSRFYKGLGKYPKYKSKRNKKLSYSTPPVGVKVDFERGKLYIPKFREGIKTVFDRRFEGVQYQCRTTTISKTPTDKYFASILVQEFQIDIHGNLILGIDGKPIPTKEPDKAPVKLETTVGVDVGLKTFVTLSDGKEYESIPFYDKQLRRLKILQRKADKKQKNSNNRKKANKKVAILHEKIVNQRTHYLHNVSLDILKRAETVCVENLNINGMKRNHSLSKSISNASWGGFIEMLNYKANWQGKNLIKINRFFPSSKTYNSCGFIKKDLTLSVRNWECSNCGTQHDRDVNAAINIKKEGVKLK